MPRYTVTLPAALWQEAQAQAHTEQMALADFVAIAITETIATAQTAQYVRTRSVFRLRIPPSTRWPRLSVAGADREPPSVGAP